MMILLKILIAVHAAQAQMSEPPVGPNYRDTGRPTRYIPPPPVMTAPSVAPVPVRRVIKRKPEPQRIQFNRTVAATEASTTSTPVLKAKRPERKRARSTASKWELSGFYNFAREIEYEGTTAVLGQSQGYSATESSAPGIGVAGAYVHRPFRGFGYAAQLGAEFNRTATQLSGSAGSQPVTSDYGGGYTTTTLTGLLNASYSLGRLFLYGGANYPYIMGANAVKLSGLPGYQAGGGYVLTRRFSVYAEYRLTRMKGTLDMAPTTLNVNEAQMSGLIFFVNFSL